MRKRGAFIVVTFAVPVICCLLAVGAFVHLAQQVTSKAAVEPDCRAAEQEQERKRAELADLESTADRLENDIEDVERDISERDAANEAQTARNRTREKERDELRAQARQFDQALTTAREQTRGLESEQKRLEDEEARLKKKFSVTTLSGAGAKRGKEALFVECTGDGAILQPDGKPLQLEPDKAAESEVLSRATLTGYVVFLIRPDGFDSFNNYQTLIERANKERNTAIQVGYEPVDADWILAYPGEKESKS